MFFKHEILYSAPPYKLGKMRVCLVKLRRRGVEPHLKSLAWVPQTASSKETLTGEREREAGLGADHTGATSRPGSRVLGLNGHPHLGGTSSGGWPRLQSTICLDRHITPAHHLRVPRRCFGVKIIQNTNKSGQKRAALGPNLAWGRPEPGMDMPLLWVNPWYGLLGPHRMAGSSAPRTHVAKGSVWLVLVKVKWQIYWTTGSDNGHALSSSLQSTALCKGRSSRVLTCGNPLSYSQ